MSWPTLGAGYARVVIIRVIMLQLVSGSLCQD